MRFPLHTFAPAVAALSLMTFSLTGCGSDDSAKAADASATTEASTEAAAPAATTLVGKYILDGLEGGNKPAEQQAKDLAVLRTNFTMEFDEDGAFRSQFLNEQDVNKPLPMAGKYERLDDGAAVAITVPFGGKDQTMKYKSELLPDGGLKLTHFEQGVAPLVMTFKKQ